MYLIVVFAFYKLFNGLKECCLSPIKLELLVEVFVRLYVLIYDPTSASGILFVSYPYWLYHAQHLICFWSVPLDRLSRNTNVHSFQITSCKTMAHQEKVLLPENNQRLQQPNCPNDRCRTSWLVQKITACILNLKSDIFTRPCRICLCKYQCKICFTFFRDTTFWKMLSLAEAYKGKYDDIEVNEEDAVGDVQVFVPKSCLTKGTRSFVFVPRGYHFKIISLCTREEKFSGCLSGKTSNHIKRSLSFLKHENFSHGAVLIWLSSLI